MTQPEIEAATRLLRDAEERTEPREPLTATWPALDPATAYRIQDHGVARRVEAGDELVGVKLGLTSRAKQQAMGVDSPLTAWLTASMRVGSDQPTPALAAPRVEPEIAVVMGTRLEGPGVDRAQALAAVREVRAGLEVIDSRYQDFRFTLPDVIADNASAARFVVSELAVDPTDIDLVTEACALYAGDELVAEATGSAVLGDPAIALALAANTLAERGRAIEAGWIVLTGGLTDAIRLGRATTVTARFGHLGALSLSAADL